MTDPDGSTREDHATEADVVDQRVSPDDADEDTWVEADQIGARRDWEASEADLIDQSIAAPLPDDEPDFD